MIAVIITGICCFLGGIYLATRLGWQFDPPKTPVTRPSPGAPHYKIIFGNGERIGVNFEDGTDRETFSDNY